MKTIVYAFWVVVGLCLILVGLANPGIVTVRAMPEFLAGLMNISPDINVPLFMVIFLSVGTGLLIGFLWEWVREHRIRAESRAREKEVKALRREVATLRAEKARDDGDEVLALLDAPAR